MGLANSLVRLVDRVSPPRIAEAHCDIPCGIYDPHQAGPQQMVGAITALGYTVPWERVDLLVLGMMGTHCQSIIERAVGELPGVVSVTVNLGTDTVSVQFSGDAITAAEIKKAIRGITVEKSREAAEWCSEAKDAHEVQGRMRDIMGTLFPQVF